ncbi:MAG TPA: nitrite/sulfite reductase [Chloroflexota bacterium]|nr:nitrite/sulfite reductase [Chloroflexota bacterium]
MAIAAGQRGVLQPLESEIEEFEGKTEAFRAGEIEPGEFRAWRLTRGTYGQRQADQQMVRIKIPFGGLDADQLDVLADLAENFAGSGKGHVTTRQNIQLHFCKLEEVPEMMRRLGDVGLTTREACSNTVRNVTACPLAGVDRTEPFDVTPYAAAFARYFLRKPENQALPRKFKVAFSGCAEDCAVLGIHDIGHQAVVKDGVPGFRVMAGGGTSTMPRKAPVIREFVTFDEYLLLAEAILAVFDRTGNRKNKNSARMKFVIEKIGFEAFKAMVDEELEKLGDKHVDLEPLLTLPSEEEALPESVPLADPIPGFEQWRRTNVITQKQPGYFAAYVTVPTGDLYPEHLRGLANVARRHNGGRVRTTITQNIVLRWLREEQLPALHRDLFELGLGTPGARTLTDVVSCPGATSCSLAITASIEMARFGLAPKVQELVERYPEAEGVSIKISGCPNGCGQHHLGAIGFEGASTKQNMLQVPSYEMWVGGGNTPDGLRLGKRIGKVAAKRAPLAVEKLLATFSAEKTDGETFYNWIDRTGIDRLKELVAEFHDVGPLHKELDSYKDWGADEVYTVIRGEGECAA